MKFCQVFDLGVCRGCCYFATADESPLTFDSPTFQHVFITSGSGWIKVSGDENFSPVEIAETRHRLYDLRGLLGSESLLVELGGDFAWLALFSRTAKDRIGIKRVPAGSSVVKATEKHQSIAVFKGQISANGKSIGLMQFARVPKDKDVALEVPDEAFAFILTEMQV